HEKSHAEEVYQVAAVDEAFSDSLVVMEEAERSDSERVFRQKVYGRKPVEARIQKKAKKGGCDKRHNLVRCNGRGQYPYRAEHATQSQEAGIRTDDARTVDISGRIA